MSDPVRRKPPWSPLALAWLPVSLYVLCILFLSFRALPPLPNIKHVDKYLHIAVYGVLALLVLRAFLITGFRYAAVLAVGATVLVGSMDELLQRWGGVRTADVFDLMADGIGAVLAMLIVLMAKELRERGRNGRNDGSSRERRSVDN